jgi:hypothetical protein
VLVAIIVLVLVAAMLLAMLLAGLRRSATVRAEADSAALDIDGQPYRSHAEASRHLDDGPDEDEAT